MYTVRKSVTKEWLQDVGEIQFGIKSVSACDTNEQLAKTFANFEVLWLFEKVFFAKFGGVASIGGISEQFTKVFSTKIVWECWNMKWTVRKWVTTECRSLLQVCLHTAGLSSWLSVCHQSVNKSYALGYLDDLISFTHLRCKLFLS